MHVRWLSAFLDFPAAEFGDEVTFWRAIAGATVSPPRGKSREFASLEPFTGDPHLRVQRIKDGPGGVHLDLHVDDPRTAAIEAMTLGAESIRDTGEYLTLRSPGGFVFCVVPWRGESAKSRPIRWPGDAISAIDQVCIDVPADLFDAEVAFWARITGRPAGPTSRPELARLARDRRLALGIALQRLGDTSALDADGRPTRATAHLDLATSSVDDEIARHEDWGAQVLTRHDSWVTMADPVGRRYCITSRNPRTGG